MTQINLVPWREQARRAKKIRFGLMLLAVIVFALLVLLGLHGRYNRLIKHQEGRNDFLSQKLGAEQGELNKLNAEKKLQLIILDQVRFVLALREDDYKTIELLNSLTHVVPEAVVFTKVMRTGSQITLIGRAKSNLQITQLMKNIESTALFDQLQLSVISGKENTSGEERTFQLIFMQKR